MNELLSPGTPEEVVPLNELMPPAAPTTGLPEASARNRAATAALFTEDVQGSYNAIMAENQQGQTGIVDKTEERAKNAGQQLDTATMVNILGDKNVPFEEKKRLIGEFSKRPAFDLKTELFNKALESDPKLPADAAIAQVTMAQQAQKWKDSAEQIDKMLNAFYASRDSSTMKGISDVAAAVIPFSSNIIAGRISEGMGNGLWQFIKDGAWQPGYKQKLKDKFNLLPPDERVAFVSNLIKSVEENAGVIFPGSNHYAAYQFMREITEEGHYTNTDKVIDAAATVLDAVGMGYTLRSAKGALKGVTKTPLKPLPEGGIPNIEKFGSQFGPLPSKKVPADIVENTLTTPITPTESHVFFHGTSEKNKSSILKSGKFEIGEGERTYDYSEWGASSAYVTGKEGFWLNKEAVENGRGVSYESIVKFSMPKDANILKINTYEDLEKLARSIGEKDAKSMMQRVFIDGVQDEDISKKIINSSPEERELRFIDSWKRRWILDGLPAADIEKVSSIKGAELFEKAHDPTYSLGSLQKRLDREIESAVEGSKQFEKNKAVSEEVISKLKAKGIDGVTIDKNINRNAHPNQDLVTGDQTVIFSPEKLKPLSDESNGGRSKPSKTDRILEVHDQAKRIELNSPIRADRPSTPLHVFAQTNPEKYRATIAAVAADTTDETAKAAAAATRTETLASAVMPQVVTSSGRVTAKVIDPFKDIAPLDDEIRHVMEGGGSLHFERPEVARAQANFTKAFTSEAEGIHAVDGMGGFSITQDGAAFNISAVYGTKAGAFSNAQEAVDQTKLALRGKGVDDSHIVLMKKDGLDYTPTTLADEAGKEGSYMVKLEGRFPFDYHDIGNFEGYDVKRNFFDSVISVDKGHASRNLLDPASMLPPVFTESMGTALDRVARVDKAFLRMADDYAFKVKGFTSKRRKAIDEYLKKANEQSIPFNRSDLAAKEGFSPEEIDAIHTWKVLGDQRWYAENADEVKTLIRDNWQKYVSKTGDEYIARPIGQRGDIGKIPVGLNQSVGRVFDPVTGTSEFVIKAETEMWYKAGGTYAELRRPVDINGELVTHIRVQNSADGYLRKLNSNDQVLNYKPMHYTRYYKSPIWVDEIVDGHRRAIAVGPDIPSAEHHIARMKKENPNKGYEWRNDARGQLAGANDKWDVDAATGRIAQRHRGKLLGTTDGTAILGDGSFVLDPTNSAIRAAQSLAGRISTREVIETAKARVVSQYGHMFPDGKFPSSVNAIYSKGNFTGSDVAAARVSVGNILYLEDAHVNFVDTFYKNSMNRIANKLGEMGAGTAERVVRVGEEISPTQSTRSLAFHAHVVLGNPVRQYFLQSLAATLRTAAYNPKNLFGGKAFSDTARFSLSRLDPSKADDFTRFVDEAGIVSSVDKHTLVNGALSDVAEHRNLLVKGVRGLVVEIPRRIGFDAGENTGQLMWHSAVYRRMQAQGLDMTKKDNIQKASSLVRAYTGEANKAGELGYNSGSLSLITQFLQMPHKAALVYTNRKVHADVTKKHLLAMGAVDLALWGAPVAVVSQVLAGDILPDDDELRYAVSQGLTAYVLNRMYKTAFGTSEPDMDFSWLSPYGYDGFTKKIFAALDGRVDDLIKSAPAYSLLSPEQGRIPIAMREMYRMFSGEVDEGMPEATMLSVLQRTLEISGGFSHASRAAAALEHKQRFDKFGRPQINEATPGVVFMQGFGIGTLDEKQAYAIAYDQNQNIKKFKEEVEQDYKETRRILTAAAASGDPDEFRIGREATNIMLKRYANNYEAKKMIIQMWKRDTMDPEDKLMLKAYKYANVPGVHLLDDQLKMAPITDEQKQLIRNRQKDLIEHLESPNKE